MAGGNRSKAAELESALDEALRSVGARMPVPEPLLATLVSRPRSHSGSGMVTLRYEFNLPLSNRPREIAGAEFPGNERLRAASATPEPP